MVIIMKNILIIAIIILSLLAIPIIAEEVTVDSMVNNFANSIRRLTKEEIVLLEERVTPQVIRSAMTFVVCWESLKDVTLEANNIIIERKDKARALKE